MEMHQKGYQRIRHDHPDAAAAEDEMLREKTAEAATA
jgi:hypothetical protein